MAEELSKTKEELIERLKDYTRPITLDELSHILETTVKYDVETKQIMFLSMLLNYTDESQQNIGLSSESVRGKSYLALELAAYFPKEDVDDRGYVSPTGFFHERGVLVDEMGQEIDFSQKPTKEASPEEKTFWKARLQISKLKVDLSRKILIFLDQPHDQLLQRLRPILSHDKKVIDYSITDRSERYGLRTKHVLLAGYATFIFCSAKGMTDEQEKTRLLLLSPGAEQNKLEASTKLICERDCNRQVYEQKIREDPERKWLANRIAAIKGEGINDIIIPDPEKLHERFKETHKIWIPRHQRDLKRLIALIKAHALLNCFSREKNHTVNPEPYTTITATQEDIDAGFKLYETIRIPNERGITPETLEIYQDIIEKRKQGITRTEIAQEYSKHFSRLLSFWRLEKEIIPNLLGAGLIIEEKDPNDKRKKIFYPTVDTYISSQQPKNPEPPKQPNSQNNISGGPEGI